MRPALLAFLLLPALARGECLYTAEFEWAVAAESDVADYQIERSNDGGVSWLVVATIHNGPGPAWSEARRRFAWSDPGCLGASLYRFRVLDAVGNPSEPSATLQPSRLGAVPRRCL